MSKTITGMKPGGFYDQHSSPQRAGMDAALPLLLDALDDIPSAAQEQAAIRLLDIGSSLGSNAIHAEAEIIARLRQKTDLPIQSFLCDLPTNDYNTLFRNLFPEGERIYHDPEVYPAAMAGSAYEQLVPSGSLHIATTFNMINWMSGIPQAHFPNHIFPESASPSITNPRSNTTEEERAPYVTHSANDLKTFYRCRARELVPGGKLLMQCFGKNDDLSTAHGMVDALSDTLLELVDKGVFPAESYEAFLWPVYNRKVEDYTQPILDDPEFSDLYTIEHASWKDVPVDFNVALEASGEVQAWSQAYTAFLRAFSEPVIAMYLPDELNNDQMMDTIFDHYQKKLAARPDQYRFSYISTMVLLTRR
ncbi:MAG: cyclopropane-fatty-acyl-phospholipid synthase [Verrucomicrobiota bacterium]